MSAVAALSAGVVIVVTVIVVVGARHGGWKSQTGYSEYQRGEEALRAWWRRVFGRHRQSAARTLRTSFATTFTYPVGDPPLETWPGSRPTSFLPS